jgi:lysozyme
MLDPGGTEVARRAAEFATPFEGTFLEPYKDPAGVWTIGTGSIWDRRNSPPTRVTAETPPIDAATALAWLTEEMQEAVDTVARLVTVPISDDQRVALADFVYNLGSGNFASSRLLHLLNNGDYTGAAAHFADWTLAGGHSLPGLVRRRAAERTLFMSGE